MGVALTAVLVLALGIASSTAVFSVLCRQYELKLFGVRLTDAATWAGVIATVVIASLVSAALPAWRAARIEPSEALRSE